MDNFERRLEAAKEERWELSSASKLKASGIAKESLLIREDRFEPSALMLPSIELPSRIFSG
jgi:hypothetical protein